jgi:hypothetical protein
MDEFKLAIFEGEIKTQCEFVLMATTSLNELLSQPPKGPAAPGSVSHATQIWCPLQTFLVSAANVSKLLWGSEDTDAPRDDLRAALQVSGEGSPIRSKLSVPASHWGSRRFRPSTRGRP